MKARMTPLGGPGPLTGLAAHPCVPGAKRRSAAHRPTEQTVIDPLVALTVAATVTERIAVGTDVLVAPLYPPVLLARSLAALDQVSAGRLVVGLGLGWSVDEFEAVGVPMPGRGRRIEEILDFLTRYGATRRSRSAPATNASRPAQCSQADPTTATTDLVRRQ